MAAGTMRARMPVSRGTHFSDCLLTPPPTINRLGQSTASMAMAVLTGMALLCYIGTLTLATVAGRGDGAARAAPVLAAVPAARSAERAHYPAEWPASPGETTGSWFIRE